MNDIFNTLANIRDQLLISFFTLVQEHQDVGTAGHSDSEGRIQKIEKRIGRRTNNSLAPK